MPVDGAASGGGKGVGLRAFLSRPKALLSPIDSNLELRESGLELGERSRERMRGKPPSFGTL